jgi:flavodoxin
MRKINLVYGTVYGSAQVVAETVATEVNKLGYEVNLLQPDQLSGFIPEEGYLILVCSTTGQGDLPDDIQPWFHDIKSRAPYLPKLKYSVIGLGDSSYETFCGAAKQLDELFAELGAIRLTERLEIDACETMEPEIEAKHWLSHWHQQVKEQD